MAESLEQVLGRDGRPLMTVAKAHAQLGVARSTFYTIEFFRTRTVYVGGAPRIDPADVDLYIANQKGVRRHRRSAA